MTAVFTLLNAWEEFFSALIFTSSYASKTVPVALAEFIGRHIANWAMPATGGFIASLPPIMLSFVGYRHPVSRLSAGGLKGEIQHHRRGRAVAIIHPPGR